MMILRDKRHYRISTRLTFQSDKAYMVDDITEGELALLIVEYILRSQGIRNIHYDGWVLP